MNIFSICFVLILSLVFTACTSQEECVETCLQAFWSEASSCEPGTCESPTDARCLHQSLSTYSQCSSSCGATEVAQQAQCIASAWEAMADCAEGQGKNCCDLVQDSGC